MCVLGPCGFPRKASGCLCALDTSARAGMPEDWTRTQGFKERGSQAIHSAKLEFGHKRNSELGTPRKDRGIQFWAMKNKSSLPLSFPWLIRTPDHSQGRAAVKDAWVSAGPMASVFLYSCGYLINTWLLARP